MNDGEITDVTRRRPETGGGSHELDVDGSVVCPGFIDTHSHSDLQVFPDPTLEPKIRQGITTEILGQDGFSMAPIRRGSRDEWQRHLSALTGDFDSDWTWGGISEYLDAIARNGVAPNVGTLVGHGTVRYEVLGMSDAEPTDGELEEMMELVTDALEEGALGFSTGLVYSPQVNSSTHELQKLASRLRPYGRPFVAHIRSEGRWIWDALDEFVDIGAEESIPLHLSHYKVSGRDQQGKAVRANHVLAAARERGVDITADQYPYTAGNTKLTVVLPPWVHADETDDLPVLLSKRDARDRIKRDIDEWRIDGWENTAARVGWENLVVSSIDSDTNEKYEGRSVADIASGRGVDPVDAVCDLLVDEGRSVLVTIHSMAEADVREIMTNERVAIATDGIFGGRAHPRVYGTYPRVLGQYVRDENLLSLEAAIRKMTSLPARIMGLESKGVIREGMDADLVVFDPATVKSRADFDSPAEYPRGIRHVLVDGEFVVKNEEATSNTPGSVVRGGDETTT